MARKFRFAVQTSRGHSREEWVTKARKIEDLGYSALLIPDHFEDQLAPVPALTAAAMATSTLRLGGLLFDNDYRHPVVFAKEMATLDLLSDGRVEVGIGAGWMRSDYDASGIAYDPPGTRIGRYAEALTILRGIFGGGHLDFRGKHYTITNYNGLPKPVQDPLPIMAGGGGRRVLSLAARTADIVAVNFNLAPGAVNREVMLTGDATSTEEKMRWIREAAGPRFDDLELNVTVFVSIVTDQRDDVLGRVAQGFGLPPEDALQSPHLLIGSVDQIVDALQERRERYGFSYIALSGDGYEAMAPVVRRLAGT